MSVLMDRPCTILPCRRAAQMDMTEELRQQAVDYGAEVVDWKFQTDRIKGLYCDGVIAVSKDIDTSAERTCVLAEELGHHLTASGDILDQRNVSSRKQELRGRIWAYNRLIGLSGIIKAYNAGCRNRYEMADILQVNEETLQDAIDYYHEKYGLCVQVDSYIIYFEPLGVMEIMQGRGIPE